MGIEIYISEIAERLWSGHASLMVGAGFSMNAKKGESATKNFPSWNDLGDCFYQKLYGKIPTEKDKGYLNVLKLAEEVEVTFGRPALNKILRDEIPNAEYQPSELHKKLLQLPWVDVFTTNYDTLLERTAEKILEQRYETVINKEDLIWSTKPRIIKLHGSFPSERPFIITEEDYRKYPKEYAPFVNTVQQSLLENTLCLIGFSGNDPNFQKWIGWIRDNLGKENSPKIFLIGKLSLSVGERRLLEDRNIIPIDLSCYSEQYYDALNIFVDKINKRGKKDDKLDWGDNDNDILYRTAKNRNDLNSKIDKIVTRWKQIRLDYPNWLILPAQKRERLRLDTESRLDIFREIQKGNADISLEFLYELNWRQEKCLIPIYNEWIEIYEKTINKYNPFPDFLQIENSLTPNNNKLLNWNLITQYWIELQLAILRFYREEGLNEKWILLAAKIDKIKQLLSPELSAWYSYERCLCYLFLLDIVSVRRELTNWASDTTLPYWEAKKAGLMAELGDVKDAEEIIDSSLTEIRSRLRLVPVKNDYSLVSQEAYILQLAEYIKYSLHFSLKKDFKEYSRRWDELKKYKCDPWGEIQSFDSYLKAELPEIKTVTKKYNFDGTVTITRHLDRTNTFVIQSYAYLRFLEEIGIPYSLPNATFVSYTLKKAISGVANYSSNWSFIAFIRTGEDSKFGSSNTIDSIFGRKALSFLNKDICDSMASKYLEVLIKSESEIKKASKYKNKTFAISLSTVIPEILSRLCVKCSYKVNIKILFFLKSLYLSDAANRSKYSGIDKCIPNLIKSFSEQEQYKLMPEFLEFPIITDENETDSYPEIFQLIHLQNSRHPKKIKIEAKIIDDLISYLYDNGVKRKNAITRLVVLWKIDLLTKEQQDNFANALWSKKNDNGFPQETIYYYWSFFNLPHPDNLDFQKTFENYFEKESMPSVVNKNGVLLGGYSDFQLFHNIVGVSNQEIKYNWKKEKINSLFLKLIECWNVNKKYLKTNYYGFMGSPSDYAKSIVNGLIDVFSKSIAPNIELIDKKYNSQIEIFLSELSLFDMPDLRAKVSFLKLFPKSKDSLFDKIHKQIYSNNEDYILDAINAILFLINKNMCISFLIGDISQNIRSRTKYKLGAFIDAINTIIHGNDKLLTDNVLNNLSIGLSFLLDEVKIDRNDTNEMVHNKIEIKTKASVLLISLRDYYLKQGVTDLPKYIADWETMCLSVNEFSEIRNVWLNARS